MLAYSTNGSTVYFGGTLGDESERVRDENGEKDSDEVNQSGDDKRDGWLGVCRFHCGEKDFDGAMKAKSIPTAISRTSSYVTISVLADGSERESEGRREMDRTSGAHKCRRNPNDWYRSRWRWDLKCMMKFDWSLMMHHE